MFVVVNLLASETLAPVYACIRYIVKVYCSAFVRVLTLLSCSTSCSVVHTAVEATLRTCSTSEKFRQGIFTSSLTWLSVDLIIATYVFAVFGAYISTSDFRTFIRLDRKSTRLNSSHI